VSNEGSDHIHDTSENSFQPPEIQNFDTNINNHGKQLIDICKNTDMKILNGRTNGDSLGRPIFHGKNGTSTVDYIICNQDLIPKAKNQVVKSPSYLSDHSQVITWVNLHKTTNSHNIMRLSSAFPCVRPPGHSRECRCFCWLLTLRFSTRPRGNGTIWLIGILPPGLSILSHGKIYVAFYFIRSSCLYQYTAVYWYRQEYTHCSIKNYWQIFHSPKLR
jgi:hypothetical protein